MIGTHSVTDVIEDTVRQHARFVYRLAYAVLRNEQEADDVAEDTFVRMWLRAEDLPPDQRAWLARIAWRVTTLETKCNHLHLEEPGPVRAMSPKHFRCNSLDFGPVGLEHALKAKIA